MSRNEINDSILIGIAGASGSGKSFFAQKLAKILSPYSVTILSQDFYYKERSSLPFEQREKLNYDNPNAIDFDLFISNLEKLKNRQGINHPIYDFSIHNRLAQTNFLNPADVVIVDGLLIFSVEKCREIFDYKIFIETPMDICFIRRLQRDTKERGRTVQSVINQYLETVRPMFLKFVLPANKYADLVVTEKNFKISLNKAKNFIGARL